MTLTSEEQKQYSRHLILDEIGKKGQLKLKKAKVLVIGAGGLGCSVLQYLTAAGVGTIGIVDDDIVSQSNLQRQILYKTKDIGKAKVLCAKNRLEEINPYITIQTFIKRLDKSNAIELFNSYDVIVGGSDNFSTRYLSNDASVIANKPLVFGSIFKFGGQVSVFNFEDGPTYRCLYPSPPSVGNAPNCSDVGVIGVLPGIIGSLQANEVLKILLGIGNVLSGKLLTFDSLSMNQKILSFSKDNSSTITKLNTDYESLCGTPEISQQISFQEYRKKSFEFNILDVRTVLERNNLFIESIHIPLNELQERFNEIPQNKKLIIFCESGYRSKIAIQILKSKHFKHQLFNLKDGLKNVNN